MRVLVTGSSGLLATNTIIQLLENKYTVRALIRDKLRCIVPYSDELEILEGDSTDLATLESAVRGCIYIVHAAAETRQGLINYRDYSKINVEVSKNICSLAVKYKIKRVIYVSTANVFGYGTILKPGNETTLIKPPFSNSLYVRSKQQAQKIALSHTHKTEIIVVNPTFLIGPYFQKSSLGRILQMSYNKKLIFYPPGGKNFVHVSDAAKAIVSALTNGRNGESYILANENLTYKEFFKKLSEFSSTKPVLIRIPKIILLTMGVVGRAITSFGIRTDFDLTNMRIICERNFYSNEKAEKDLKIEFRSIDLAINEAMEWFIKNRTRLS